MRFKECYRQDIDLWVYFAKAANVEDFILTLYHVVNCVYDFPQFGYMNSFLKNMVLRDCQLNPTGSISWSSLISLSIGDLKLTDGVMEKVLSGCPNLESLEIDKFSGLNRLEISSVKVRKLIIGSSKIEGTKAGHLLEIFAPYVQNLQLLGSRHEMLLQLRNVASLVTAFLGFTPYIQLSRADDDEVDRECSYLNELLQSLVHVKNLELGPWCIEFLSILVLKGWQSPASSRRILTLNAALVQQDFPAICSLLQSSPDLETLVIDWTKHNSRHFLLRFIDEDENGRMFEKHIFDCLMFHLRTVKIINYYGPLRANKYIMPLVKHLLKNAEVLEKMVIAASLRYNKFEGSDVSRDFVEMAQELLSFPRSSKHAVVLFSY
ncbi:F-box/LRR-repeat protein At3g03360-like [Lycium ferocissimum]|uniref:F-box/LRR-repeat protein At3g03360-like n=1 Tax=Lycium ferocissimum TaxID=112874 RepID=UPI00281516FA|nr:F-box/LRR-repeat protein At3g03360-like [Lycium ferocissimum]